MRPGKKDLREGFAKPRKQAAWRAQRLADDRDLPDLDVMAAMIDTLPQSDIRRFFHEEFSADRAYCAFAAGRTFGKLAPSRWERSRRLRINPYLLPFAEAEGLGLGQTIPVLAAISQAAPPVEEVVLPNGIPVHIMRLPDTEYVRLGGVRTFPFLSEEAADRNPGRLVLYEWLANVGYSKRGGAIRPYGERLKWHTELDVTVGSLWITASGPTRRFKDVAAAMHKRLAVDKLNSYALGYAIETMDEWVTKWRELPSKRALTWRRRVLLGDNHPVANSFQPDESSIGSWSIGKVDKLHKKLCRTGNLQLIVTGDVTSDLVRRVFAPDFSDLPDAKPVKLSPLNGVLLEVTGGVVNSDEAEVAVLQLSFPPATRAGTPDLTALDVMVVGHLFESHLLQALNAAALDSVDVQVGLSPAGVSVLPFVRVTSRLEDAARVLATVQEGVKSFTAQPPTASAEARARLQLAGPLLEDLLDPADARDWLVYWGRFGPVPTNPLADLCGGNQGELAARAPELFTPGRYAWTVTAKAGVKGIPGVGARVE